MLDAMKTAKTTSSSCPSPEAFAEKFRMGDNVFAVTITGNLSGTYNSALQAKAMVQEEFPEKNIHVIDSWSTGGTLILILKKLGELIAQGLEFEEIVKEIDEYREKMRIVFTLFDFTNLVKTGRMSAIAGMVASALSICALAHNPGGVIKVLEKPRGEKRAIERLVAMLDKFQYKAGTPVAINHCQNPEAVAKVVRMMKETYGTKDEEISIYDCGCLDNYYAGYRGVLIAFEGVIPEEFK
jgi:DegV family protein with EDD domain